MRLLEVVDGDPFRADRPKMQPDGGCSRAAVEKKGDRALGTVLLGLFDISDEEHVGFGLTGFVF